MPTINEVLERVSRVRPDALDDKTKAEWLIELDGKLYREVILRHRLTPGQELRGPVAVCPECGATEGLGWDQAMDSCRCSICGWRDLPKIPEQFPEDGDEALLAPPPYDKLYDLYLMAQIDFYNREMDHYNNSALAANTAIDEFKKDYHRRHEPLGAGGFVNVF